MTTTPLNADQATQAQQDLDVIADRDERREANAQIGTRFAEYLAAEYASTLTLEIQNAVYARAWDRGHSSGYHEVENEYLDLADLAARIVRSVR